MEHQLLTIRRPGSTRRVGIYPYHALVPLIFFTYLVRIELVVNGVWKTQHEASFSSVFSRKSAAEQAVRYAMQVHSDSSQQERA